MILTPGFISDCSIAIIGFWILTGFVVLCVAPFRRNAPRDWDGGGQ